MATRDPVDHPGSADVDPGSAGVDPGSAYVDPSCGRSSRHVSSIKQLIETTIQLKREIKLPAASAIMTGLIIGSGIFVSPVSIIQHCGSIALSLILWIVCGVITLGIVLSYSELGGIYPKAGGDYAFFKAVLGPFPAFLNVWVQFLTVQPTFQAICALTASNYLLKPFFPDCDLPAYGAKLLSIWILVTLAILNSIEVKHAGRFQIVFTITKLAALFIIILSGIVQLIKGKTEHLATGFQGTTTDPGSIAIALVSGLFTYGGWNCMFNLLEEIKRPERVVPQASVISLVTIIILYVMTNVAYFTVLSPAEMAASPAVAVTFADRTLGMFAVVIPVFVACSSIGALHGAILGGSRKYFAAARDGMFPDILATIHVKYSTPLPAIWATCAFACLYIVAGDAIKLIEYLGFVDTFIYGLAMYCVIHLKVKQPNLERPIKMPMFVPVTSLLMMVLAFVLGLYKEPYRNGVGALIILSGVPAYLIGVVWKSKPRTYEHIKRKVTVAIQKMVWVLPQD